MSLYHSSPPEEKNQAGREKIEPEVELETNSVHIEQWFHRSALSLFETLRREARHCEQTK